MTTGIYQLHFANTNKVYIGQSLNIEVRYKQHVYKLRKGSAAGKLQKAYYTYGEPNYSVIIECLPEELNKAEAETVEIFNSVNEGFNTLTSTQKGLPSSCQVGEKASRAKFSNEQIISVLDTLCDYPELNQQEIADITGTTKGTVGGISSGAVHKWLRTAFPEKYETMLKMKGKRTSYSVKGSKVVHHSIFPKVENSKGEVFEFHNISHFCEEHNLHKSSLSKLLRGLLKSHKGWKLSLKE